MERYSPIPEKHDLRQSAYSIIAEQSDPIARAELMVAGIDGGLPLTTTELLENIHQISDEDERAPDRASSFQSKLFIAGRAIEALANQQRYAETDNLARFLEERSFSEYFSSVTTLLKNGYGGPNDAYFHWPAAELMDLAIQGPDQPAEVSPANAADKQQYYLSNYLVAIARNGFDIMDPNNEYAATAEVITNDLQIAQGEKSGWKQYILRHICHEYVSGQHTALGERYLQFLDDYEDRALMYAGMMEYTDDVVAKRRMRAQIDGLCPGVLNQNPRGGPREQLRLRLLYQMARSGPEGASEARENIGKPGRYLPDEQLKAHLEIYKQLGDYGSRLLCLEFFNKAYSTAPNTLSDYLLQVAEADIAHGNSTSFFAPLPGVVHPRVSFVCQQIDEIYYLNESEQADIEAGLSLSLPRYRQQRDRASAALASFLAKQRSLQTADYFLNRIVASEEKVKGFAAVARQLDNS